MPRPAIPFNYAGGKANIAWWVISHFPPHEVYVEVFGGCGAVLLAKPESPLEVYNDIDSGIVNLFRVLRDPEKSALLEEKLRLTPYSREEWRASRDIHFGARNAESDVERAWATMVLFGQSFGGSARSWGFSTSGRFSATKRFSAVPDRIQPICRRLRNVQIENLDFRKCIKLYDSEKTLFYLDPPYCSPERRGLGKDRLYGQNEMSEDDHRELVEILLGIKGMSVLSGYQNDIYRKLEENGHARFSLDVRCYLLATTKLTGRQGLGARMDQKRTECLWVSPNAMSGLPSLFNSGG